MGRSGELESGRGGIAAGRDVGGTRRVRLAGTRDRHARFNWDLKKECFLVKSSKIPQLNFGRRNPIIPDFSYNL